MAGDRSDERELQGAYQAWMQVDRGSHLDEAAWQRLAAGDAAPSDRDVLFAHIMSCAQCSDVWRSVSLLAREAEAEGLIAHRSAAPRPFFRSMFIPVAIAAMLMIAVGTTIVMRRPAPGDTILRGSSASSSVDGLMMAYAADGTPTLVWTPIAAATTYRVEIFSEDGQPIWMGDVDGPPLRWPAEASRAIGMYRWRVTAVNGGATLGRSRLTPLELSR